MNSMREILVIYNGIDEKGLNPNSSNEHITSPSNAMNIISFYKSNYLHGKFYSQIELMLLTAKVRENGIIKILKDSKIYNLSQN